MTKIRLSDATLDMVQPTIGRPAYQRRNVAIGAVHLGVGAFHRAHQAAIFDDVLARGDLRWGIAGASLRSGGIRDRLAPQDGLFTLVERGGIAPPRIIGALRSVLVGPEDRARLIAAMAAPSVHLVTLTITEKGYAPASGDRPTQPVGAGALLVAALAQRRARGLAPFTVLSCDNLAGNGARLRALVLAAATDPALRDWIDRNGAFPNTMVDRIVPATTEADIAVLADQFGVEDAAMVNTEPFRQWVIEDRFAGPRPDFGAVGVDLVADVRPWETAKLRLLNGAHSALAYLGALAGAEFIHQAVAEPGFGAFIDALWDESAATLIPQPGLDLDDYRRRLRARFANAELPHRTRQIAVDGSQKLAQRLVAPLRQRLARGEDSAALALAIAGWMRWQLGRDDTGTAFAVDDPLAPRTARLLAGTSDAAGMVAALLSIEEVFGDLASDPRVRAMLGPQLDALLTRGAAAVVESQFADAQVQ